MDENIGKMFRDKNKEIFLNSLTLDVERNSDALKSTTDNCVALEINKLSVFLKSYFKEQKIPYKKDELQGILYREKVELNKIINNRIEEKKVNIVEGFINDSKEKDNILSNFLEDFSKTLDDETNKMNEDLDLAIKTRICLDFSQYIIKKYDLQSEEQIERINSRINILFKDIVIKRVKDETMFRDESLRNQTKESYDKYRNLNENTYGKFANVD